MRKIYSLVLMAAMLFVGANAWAVTHQVATTQQLETAWANAQSGDIIQLTTNVDMTKSLWLGTLEMNGTPRSLTLDLNGHKLINDGTREKLFFISHGELNVITSVAGGEIQHGTISEDSYSSSYVMFLVAGSTYKTLNPKTATSGYYTHLTIGSGVTLTAKSIAVAIDALGVMAWPISASTTIGASGVTIPSSMPNDLNTKIYPTKGRGVANGVRIDVHGYIRASKYAFKSNGLLGAPSDRNVEKDPSPLTGFVVDPANPGLDYTIANTDTAYTPFIRLYSTADMWVQADNNSAANDPKKPVAVYCSGYSRWLIEGTCVGSTGVYVKSGDVDIHDATIQSTYTGTYTPPTGTGSGTQGQGSAIVIESNEAYAGEIDVNIGGDTKVTATNGYAIDEKVTVTTNDTTKVNSIVITGGSFEGGKVGGTEENPQYGTISISEQTNQSHQGTDDNKNDTTIIKVGGGSVEGNVTVGNEGNLSSITDDNTYVTTVTDPETGNQTLVINTGTEPIVAPNNFDIDDFTTGDVNLSDPALVNKNQVFDNPTVFEHNIGTLMMNGADSVKLTITTGHTLKADKVIMGYKAQIIVEAGAKLIVTGEQGIVAPSVDNIILKTQEGNPSFFLFNPAVTSNRHPHATVELVSKGRTVGGHQYWQRFGIPDNTGLKRADIVRTNPTAFKYIDLEDDTWKDMPAGEDMIPFIMYAMSTQQATMDTYKFKCELVGNVDGKLPFADHSWNYFANSYTARMDIAELFESLDAAAGRDKSAYIYQIDNNWWDIVNVALLEDGEAAQTMLDPMQAFIIKNNGAAANDNVNYNNAVWTPATTPATAPARVMDNNLTKAVITIKDENGNKSKVAMRQSSRFSDEYDNGYDTEILMNPNTFNVYTTTEFGNMAHVATDNIVGTSLTIATQDETMFTMTFSNLRGQQLAIRDRLTGTTTLMNESVVYYFTTSANDVSERFEIVEPQQMPTEVEVVENENEVRSGIYSVMGQYMGEDWNSLPKSIYIVNGNKVVK